MTAEHDHRPRCFTGKVKFATSGEAEAELVRAQGLRERGVTRLEIPKTEARVYPCINVCGGWHITSEEVPPSERPRRRHRRRPGRR